MRYRATRLASVHGRGNGSRVPGGLVYFYVDDVDAVAAEFGVNVEEQPWAREIEITDPDGNRLRVGTTPV